MMFILIAFFAFMQASCYRNAANLKEKADKILGDIGNGTAQNDFPEKYFPKSQTVLLMGQLQNYCDFKNRRGNFINDFRGTNNGIGEISYLYEFYLKCDTVRFIFTFILDGTNDLYKMRLESVKKDNPMILHPERRLKF